ncbi:hypothetical protein DRQ53_14140, partial [bacterium]
MAKLLTALAVLLTLGACSNGNKPMSDARLREFATRYATAWSTQDPQRFAAFYTEDGRLQINDGDSSIGREAIAATAGVFMAAFPDMIVDLVSVAFDGDGDVDGDGDGDGDG